MDYYNYTTEQLLKRIEELEILNRELLKEKEQETRLDYAWTGNLGHWYWNIKTNTVTFNPLKVISLGYDKSEIPEHVTYQFFTDKLHPDDYQKTMEAMLDHLHGKVNVYEVEYRIRAKDGKYKWYNDRGKITQYDEKNKPLLLAGIVFDITQKKELEIELKQKNKTLALEVANDGLTKLNNHKKLFEQLNSEIADAKRTNKPLSVLLFDLDDFKKVNDNYGHIYGDQVLVNVADIIGKSIRNTDIAGRYGGEEFMVIFPNTNITKAVTISERIRKAIENYEFFYNLTITISGGVKQYNGENVTALINSADKNLYEAKNKGKNQIVYN